MPCLLTIHKIMARLQNDRTTNSNMSIGLNCKGRYFAVFPRLDILHDGLCHTVDASFNTLGVAKVQATLQTNAVGLRAHGMEWNMACLSLKKASAASDSPQPRLAYSSSMMIPLGTTRGYNSSRATA